eukprot:scaffold5157_cov22-Tisochrysis_lutea.AAC.3
MPSYQRPHSSATVSAGADPVGLPHRPHSSAALSTGSDLQGVPHRPRSSTAVSTVAAGPTAQRSAQHATSSPRASSRLIKLTDPFNSVSPPAAAPGALPPHAANSSAQTVAGQTRAGLTAAGAVHQR